MGRGASVVLTDTTVQAGLVGAGAGLGAGVGDGDGDGDGAGVGKGAGAGADGDVGEGATGGLPGCGAGAGVVALPGMGAGGSAVFVSLPPQADASSAAARAENRAMRAGCRVLRWFMGGFLKRNSAFALVW